MDASLIKMEAEMKLLRFYYLYFISVIFLFGCSTKFLLEIDAISDKGKENLKKYVLLPANEGVSINDLR